MFDSSSLDSGMIFQLIVYPIVVVVVFYLIVKRVQKIGRRRRLKEVRKARVASLVSKHRF